MSYDNLSSVSQNVLKCYQQFTIFTFAIPELLDLIWRKNRMFTLCCMITWVVFLRMFWNFISTLPVKRGGSLSFLVGTISNVLVMEIGWTDVGSGGYILVSCAHSNTSLSSCCAVLIFLLSIRMYSQSHNSGIILFPTQPTYWSTCTRTGEWALMYIRVLVSLDCSLSITPSVFSNLYYGHRLCLWFYDCSVRFRNSVVI
jgi:hypothetical protein